MSWKLWCCHVKNCSSYIAHSFSLFGVSDDSKFSFLDDKLCGMGKEASLVSFNKEVGFHNRNVLLLSAALNIMTSQSLTSLPALLLCSFIE